MPLNIVFAGTPEFAAEHLKTLVASEHNVVAVYSQPDRPAGRGRKLTPSAVKAVALEHDLPVYQPKNFKDPADVAALAELKADIMVVVAYGLLLPESVLNTPPLGCINVHASLLPRWRGAAPIHRSLLAGDTETGVTIMQMDVGLDTGDMLVKTQCAIRPSDTSASLHDRLITLGQPALLDALAQLEQGKAQPEQQDDALATYARKLEKAEGALNWQQSAVELDRQIRGLTPWPGSYCVWQGDTVRVHGATLVENTTELPAGDIVAMSPEGIDVATGEGILRLTTLQWPGKKAMPVADILNARRAALEAHPRFDLTPANA